MFSHVQQVRAVRVTEDNDLWLQVEDSVPTMLVLNRLIAVLSVLPCIITREPVPWCLLVMAMIVFIELCWRLSLGLAKKKYRFVTVGDKQWTIVCKVVFSSADEPYKLFVQEVLPVLQEKYRRITFKFDTVEARAIETVYRFLEENLCNADNLSYNVDTQFMTFRQLPKNMLESQLDAVVVAHLRAACDFTCDTSDIAVSANMDGYVQPDLEQRLDLDYTLLPQKIKTMNI